MTPEQIISKLEALNAGIILYRHSESYMRPDHWRCTVTFAHDGNKFEIKGQGSSMNEAIAQCWAKGGPLIDTLTFAQTFSLPLLTIEAAPIRSQSNDDPQF